MESTVEAERPWLLFASGAPGAGKSSIVQALLERVPITTPAGDLLVFDADWLLEPTSALTRQDMTTAAELWPAYRRVWLRVLEMVARNRRSVALFTPGAPRDLPAVRWPVRTDWCLLDCDDSVRARRLREREWPAAEIEDAIADASALRRQASFTVDTSHTTPEGAAEQLLAWFTTHR
jgi:hypothetical protein